MVLGVRRISRTVLASLVVCGGIVSAGCQEDSQTDPVSIDEHLYGPGARLGQGVTIPEGATRVGPTIAIAQDKGVVVSQISMLQIDGDPDAAIEALLTELDRIVPDAEVNPARSRRRCWLDESHEWIRQCRMLIAGHTRSGRPIQVDITVTPTADAGGEPMPGTTGLPHARVLVRTGTIRGTGTNLFRPRDYPYSIADQEAAGWPIASGADAEIEETADTVPGADDWPTQPGGSVIGAVYSNPRYVVVAVEDGENLDAVAMSYATAVPGERVSTTVVASVSQRTTTSFEIDSVEGGPGAHLWTIDRPGTDYLFLRYWPARS